MNPNVPAPRTTQPQDPTKSVEGLSAVVQGFQRPDRRAQLMSLLGSDHVVDRFLTVTIHALSGNSDLLTRCTPLSIMEAVREAATLDLEPTGILGEAWIIRHGDRAVLRVGYRGYLKLIRRTEEVAAVDCQVVYENDTEFDVQLGTDPKIIHVPTLEADRGNYKGAYAWARLNNGELIIEWMPLQDIESVRRVSQARNGGPWNEWWTEMARKTVIRRLAKRLPLSTYAEQAVAVDEQADKVEAGEDRPTRETRRKVMALLEQGQEFTPDEQEALDKALANATE